MIRNLVTCLLLAGASITAYAQQINLARGWRLQSACKVKKTGESIATSAFQPEGWLPISIPSTVVGAQVTAGQLPDPFVGMNLRQFPGVTYKIGDMFSLRPMDPQSSYACSWWYRTAFRLPVEYRGHRVALHFQGINYRANVWLNGQKLADSAAVAGAYRIHELDVTATAKSGAQNVLAVEVFAPTEKNLAINWVDWSPTPPDKNMGIWGDVYFTASGPVTVRYPLVSTKFPGEPAQQADLTVRVELRNHAKESVRGTLEAQTLGAVLRQQVTLAPGESRSVTFTPEAYPPLKVKNPKLWWPVQMGAQNLHPLTVRFLAGGRVSELQHTRFGIREITSELKDNHRLFRVNGKRVLIRGGGWAQDMLLRRSRERMEAQLQYVRAMNLNTIRMEAQLDSDDAFFDRTDELGILVMAGWCCCDIWERWTQWEPDTHNVATESLRSQILRLRNHPSLLVWLNGSDGPPPADVETAYLKVEEDSAWPNPTLSSASADPTTVTGPSGVKMTGPYDYVPPSYWLTDTSKYGGAWSFNTETSPGPAIPVEESIRKMIPKHHLWPVDEVWNYHAGGERFQDTHIFNEAMDKTYGPPASLEEFLRKSQAMAYDGQRAMFEAYARNKYTSTGVIQWMMNNAWPSLIWHLYDVYLQPAGGYFGTRKACEPLHLQYSYDDRSVVLVSSLAEAAGGLIAKAEVFDFDLKELFSQELVTNIEADGVRKLFTIPPFPEKQPAVYFVKLSLRNHTGKQISSNFYWLPAELSTMAWDKTPDTAYTPIATFEDLTLLNRLPRVQLQTSAHFAANSHGRAVEVKLHNPGKHLAFQAQLAVEQGGHEVLPVLWDDNYVTLLPGETRVLHASYLSSKPGRQWSVRIAGWNFEPMNLPLEQAASPTKK